MNKISSYTVANLMWEGAEKLKKNGITSVTLDSRILLSHVTSYSPEELILKNDMQLSSQVVMKFFKLIEKRQNNEPIAYIIGKKEFYSIDFLVDKDVLIPRPDSEILIDLVKSCIKSEENISILDLGTGSGCLILTLLTIFSHSTGLGIDISNKAIQNAQKNSVRLHLENKVDFLRSDWSILKLKNKFNLIISNPPYIKAGDISSLQKDVRDYESRTALDGGKDGLDCYRSIFKIAKRFLKKNGLLIVEIGSGQFDYIKKIASAEEFKLDKFKRDLSGKIRVVSFR